MKRKSKAKPKRRATPRLTNAAQFALVMAKLDSLSKDVAAVVHLVLPIGKQAEIVSSRTQLNKMQEVLVEVLNMNARVNGVLRTAIESRDLLKMHGKALTDHCQRLLREKETLRMGQIPTLKQADTFGITYGTQTR